MKFYKQWYNEYHNDIRIHDYFSFMINQFPIIVVRKIDNPHSTKDDMDRKITIGLIGLTWTY